MTEEKNGQPLTLIPLAPAALAELIEAAAERATRKALAEREGAAFLSTEQTAELMGFRRADGGPNTTALKSFRQRHPSFNGLACRVGSRLRWRRSEVERWLAEHRQEQGADHAAD